MEKKKVVFLDRDGTINIDHAFVHSREEWQWCDGAIEGMRLLQEAGFTLTVVTNQSGIGAGYYTEAEMHDLHAFMISELKKAGVEIAVVAFCPHSRDAGCDCRKPNIEMANQIEEKIGLIDYERSWTIGDKILDLEFGKKAGTQTVLLRSEYWREAELLSPPTFIASSLLEAAQKIVSM